MKYDGYRIIARKAGDEITLFSRSGLDWTVRFPAIAKALQTLPCDIALIDGEIAFVLPSGLTSFKSLQEHIDTPNPAIRYFVFDLLSLDGKDWRKKPLIERRAQLAELLAEKERLRLSHLCRSCGWLGTRVLRASLRGRARRHRVEACRPALHLRPRQETGSRSNAHARRGIRHRRL